MPGRTRMKRPVDSLALYCQEGVQRSPERNLEKETLLVKARSLSRHRRPQNFRLSSEKLANTRRALERNCTGPMITRA
jgi:hypothetical protein